MAARKGLILLAVLVLTAGTCVPVHGQEPVRKDPGGLMRGLADGLEVEQPVGDGVNAQIGLTILPQSDQATVGAPYRFDVNIVGDPFYSARNVSIRVSARIRRAGQFSPAADREVRFDGARVRAHDGSPEAACTGTGVERTCAVGSLPAQGETKIAASIRTAPGVRPGDLVLSAHVVSDPGRAARPETVALVLVERARLSNVGLTIRIYNDTDIVGAGLDAGHMIRVRNASYTEAATAVLVEIRQRIGANLKGTFQRLPDDGFKSLVSHPACKLEEGIQRCAIGTLAAGQEVRIPVEFTIVANLSPKRWGRVETQARVKSAETDPDLGDNFAKASTAVVSTLPEIAFLLSVSDANGNTRVDPREVVRSGETFGIAARFMDALVEPGAYSIVLRLTIDKGAPLDVTLRLPADRRDRIYRSSPMILLPPKAPTDPGSRVPIYAASGSRLTATYGKAEASATVVDR